MSNYYSERLERFLTPGEVERLGYEVKHDARYYPGYPSTPDPLYGRLRYIDPLDPRVVLIHVVSDERHSIHLYLNETELRNEEHVGGHDCVELLAVRIADALDAKIDERRVSVPDLVSANAKVKRPWSLLDFSETVDWPTRSEIEPHKRHLQP